MTDDIHPDEHGRGFDEIQPPLPPMSPEQHAIRIRDLERELVADAIRHYRAWRALRQLVAATKKDSPLGKLSAARQKLTVAVRSLIEFYADTAHHGLAFTTYQMSKRVICITRTMPPAPKAMSSWAWRKFFELVAAVQHEDADSAVVELINSLTREYGDVTDEYWLERAAAYNVCMQQYGILEKTRV